MNTNLRELTIENYIWIIYIFISVLAIISNYYEEKYYYFKVFQDRQKQRYVNLTIFGVAIIIYLYFLSVNLRHIHDNNYSPLSVFASTLFVIAGIIIYYVEYKNAQDEGIAIF